MISTEEVVQKLREFKKKYGQHYGIAQFALFGSVARGEQRENSDVDVCIRPNKDIDYFTLQDIKEELEKLVAPVGEERVHKAFILPHMELRSVAALYRMAFSSIRNGMVRGMASA